MATDLTPSEIEAKESKRLIGRKPVPSRKPAGRSGPKFDNRRRRMKVSDPDLQKSDPDMSLKSRKSFNLDDLALNIMFKISADDDDEPKRRPAPKKTPKPRPETDFEPSKKLTKRETLEQIKNILSPDEKKKSKSGDEPEILKNLPKRPPTYTKSDPESAEVTNVSDIPSSETINDVNQRIVQEITNKTAKPEPVEPEPADSSSSSCAGDEHGLRGHRRFESSCMTPGCTFVHLLSSARSCPFRIVHVRAQNPEIRVGR